MKSRIIVAIGLLVLTTVHHLSAASDIERRVDSLCAQFTSPESPGCVIGVIEDGKLVLAKGYGLAELENGVAMTESTKLDIGSNAKQFTATCILLLEEQGKLKLDDELRTFIPEFPKYAWPITLRHLLQHTSGIRDYFDLMTLKGMNIGNNYPDAEYLKLIYSQTELNFPPGEQQLYSNSGFILLAEVVRRVSGMTLAQFAQQNIFDVLKMTSSVYLDDPFLVIKNRASSYGSLPGGGYWHGASIATNIGDGGILTTVGDLSLWDANFYQNQLGKKNPELMRKLEARTVLNNGDTIQWAMALRHDQHAGRHVIRHGGAYYGFRSEIARFPEEHLTTIVLANLMTIDATGLAYKVADLFLPALPPAAVTPAPAPVFAKLTTAQLAGKSGTFHNPVSGTVWSVTANDSALSVSTSTGYNFQLLPLDAEHFQPTGIALPGTVTYVSLADGSHTFDLVVPGQQTARFQPIKIDPTPQNLDQYVGEFHCRELDLTFVVSLEGDGLGFIEKGGSERVPISATMGDEFVAQDGQTQIRFERDKSKHIQAMRLSLPRAKNILFERSNS